jgi:hypothetical protein
MVPSRQYRGAVLPWEKQLMDALGMSPDEYAWYASEVANIKPERNAAYDLVPNVECIPLVPLAMTIVGAGLSYAASALAPKPKIPRQDDPGGTSQNIEGENISNNRKFANVDGFTSVQNVARLGEVAPLVFAKREQIGSKWYGGVRAETKLLWSQLLSQGDGQELVALFALNAMAMAKPDFEGLAIGDTLLKNYQEPKLCIYYRSGDVTQTQRLNSSTKIGGALTPRSPSDIIVAEYANQGLQAIFSGTRTPTGSTEFGTYQPVRNGQDWRLPFKRVKVVFDYKNITADSQRSFELAKLERQKIESYFGSFCGINVIDSTSYSGYQENFQEVDGNEIEYTIYADQNETNFAEHGSADILNKRKTIGEQADNAFTVGETYSIGSAQGVCISTSTNVPYDGTFHKSYRFKITSRGLILALGIGKIVHPGIFRTMLGSSTAYPTISKLAIGSVTTTRAVDQVEIGIKSIVYKRFNGLVNFSSIQSEATAEQIEAGGGNVTYGTYTDYGFRYSFFHVEYRKSSGDSSWQRISDRPFGVKGTNPVGQYNFIRLAFYAGADIYEVRFVPVSGGAFIRLHQYAYILDASNGSLQSFASKDGGVNISYVGNPGAAIDAYAGTNKVMYWGGVSGPIEPTNNAVTAFAPDSLITSNPPAPGVYGTSGGDGSGLTVKVAHENIINSFSVTSITTGWRQRWLHMGVLGVELPSSAGQRTTGNLSLRSSSGRNIIINIMLYSVAVNDPIYTSDMNQAGYSGYTYGWISEFQVNETIQPDGFDGGIYNGEEFYVDIPPGWSSSVSRVGIRANTTETTIVKLFVQNKGSNYGYRKTFTVNGTSLPAIMITGLESTPGSAAVGRPVNIWDAVSDVYLFSEEEGSHQDSPEHQIVYVNEQRRNSTTPIYNSLALAGMQLRSGKDWSSFSNFSYYAKSGRVIPLMVDSSGNSVNSPTDLNVTGASHLFPEILRNLLRSTVYGSGALVPEAMIDWDGFRAAARACQANGWFFDGVLSAQTNVREWAYQHAPYFMLDFVIKGGKISLAPTYPIDPSSSNGYGIDYARQPKISALFTDGNIIEDSLQVNWYSTEQRLAPQVVVTYRQEIENGFAETRNVLVRLVTSSEAAPTEAVDFTGFCTNVEHAKTYAKLLIQVRANTTHTVQFKTLPEAVALEPGAYFKLSSTARHVASFQNGHVLNDGKVVTTTSLDSQTATVYWWRSGMAAVESASMTVDSSGIATDPKFRGAVFTVYDPADQYPRVYKVESIAYDEDGLLDIGASHVGTNANGAISYLDLDDNKFVIEVQS